MRPNFSTGALRTTIQITLNTAITLTLLNTISPLLPADAHEAMSGWSYPVECCSDKDCAEYPAENVTIVGDGFQLKEGEYVPRAKARVSPDGHYHICRYQWESGQLISSNSAPCFWYPPQGM